jgi:hypothetical protein
MVRLRHEIRSGRRALVGSGLVRAVGTGLFVAVMAVRPALGAASGEPASPAARPGAGSGAPDPVAGQPARSKPPRLPGLTWLRGEPDGTSATGSDRWGWGTIGLALVLAICGVVAIAAQRSSPRVSAGAVQVVGRVSLSPRHSVYLLRVGRRVLVVGAGPQGPPALITELADEPQGPPATQQGAES